MQTGMPVTHTRTLLLQDLLGEMSARGLPLGVDTYCLLMDSAASSGEETAVQRVQGLLRAMRAQGLAPDSVQRSTLSKAFVRQGRGAEAIEAASGWWTNTSDDQVAKNQMVHLLCHQGRMEQAEAAAESARQAAAATGRPPPVEAYGALIRGYYRRRELGPLLASFRAFLRMGGRPNRKMSNAVVRMCLVNGKLSIAMQVRARFSCCFSTSVRKSECRLIFAPCK